VEANTQLDIYCTLVLEQILKDKGFAPTEEPFKKLINQGMILGTRRLCSILSRNIQIEPIYLQNLLDLSDTESDHFEIKDKFYLDKKLSLKKFQN
jgi:leucyl-tRNA synthetase